MPGSASTIQPKLLGMTNCGIASLNAPTITTPTKADTTPTRVSERVLRIARSARQCRGT